MKIDIRKMQPGDEEGLSQLVEEVFNENKSIEYWRWKYFENPCGFHQTNVAMEGDECVGIMGAVPIKVIINNTVFFANQGVDIVVSPKHRKNRTFFRLEKAATRLCLEYHSVFTYAFSVEDTYRLFTKLLRFQGVSPVFNMNKIINPTPYIQRYLKFKIPSEILGGLFKNVIKRILSKSVAPPKGLRVFDITYFDQRFDDLWSHEAPKYGIAIVRDSEYLNWRYIENPSPYKIIAVGSDESIEGFVVIKSADEIGLRRGRIVDFLIRDNRPAVMDTLFSTAIKHLIDEDVDVITCWLIGSEEIHAALKKKRFIKRKTNHDLMIRTYSDKFSNEFLADESRWYMTMGDSDYF